MQLTVEEKSLINIIITLRGEKVIIDRDLADIYQVKTKVFNQAIKRNLPKFEGFMFQLNDDEKDEVVTNCDHLHSLKFSHSNPYAFTEHGVLMVSSVLNSKVAVEVNRSLINAFVFMRQKIFESDQFLLLQEQIKKIELEQENLKLKQALDLKIQDTKLIQFSRNIKRLSEILDDFQQSHVVLKKSDMTLSDDADMN